MRCKLKYLNSESEQFAAAHALAEELPRDLRVKLAVLLIADELSPADVKDMALKLLNLYNQLVLEQKV